jgi:DNA repair exonuclease SbcCD ATPase subunit
MRTINGSIFAAGARHARIAVPLALLLVAVALSVRPVTVRAEDNTDAITPVEEFSRQLEEFQKSVPDLNKKIQDSAGAIDGWTDVEKARTEIEKLREAVGNLLGAVSDNGGVSELGTKALNHVHDKLRTLSQETRFKPEERQFLIDQWRKLEDQTGLATKELDDARKQFADLLRTLQSNEDFISELVQIRQAQKALDVIKQLTRDIRDASNQLNKLIGGIRPPGA